MFTIIYTFVFIYYLPYHDILVLYLNLHILVFYKSYDFFSLLLFFFTCLLCRFIIISVFIQFSILNNFYIISFNYLFFEWKRSWMYIKNTLELLNIENKNNAKSSVITMPSFDILRLLY